MRYAKFLLLIIVVITIPLSLSLTINNVSTEITVIKGKDKVINLNITNPSPYTLYNLYSSPSFVSLPSNLSIQPYKSRIIPLTILTNFTGTKTVKIMIMGFRKENCSIVKQITPHNITIFAEGSYPSHLDICRGESVKFINKYESWIKVKVYPDVTWSNQINSNSSYVRVFDSVGVFPFEVYPLIPGGSITVVDETILIHSSEDDLNFTLTINSILEHTNLSIETVSKTSFNISYDKSGNGFLVIKNMGDKQAIDIKLEGKWLSFDKNNFNLDPQESVAVNFVITPYVESEDETNKTYIIQLKVKSNNSEEKSVNLSVFIPYAPSLSTNITTASWWEAKKHFCDTYPTSPYCITEPVVVYKPVPEYDCPAVLANLSPQDVQRILREGLKAYDAAHSTFNYIKIKEQNTSQFIDDIRRDNNNTKVEIIKIRESINNLSTILFVTVFGLVFLIILIFFFYTLYQYLQRKRSIGGKL